jgi:hypothetical protein
MAKAGHNMTQTATPERVKLAQIVASGLHQLAAAAAHQEISDRFARDKTTVVFDELDRVAGNMKAPYIEALVKLAGDDFLMAMTCNESCIASQKASKAGTDGQIDSNTGIQGTNEMHGRPSRRGRKAKGAG